MLSSVEARRVNVIAPASAAARSRHAVVAFHHLVHLRSLSHVGRVEAVSAGITPEVTLKLVLPTPLAPNTGAYRRTAGRPLCGCDRLERESGLASSLGGAERGTPLLGGRFWAVLRRAFRRACCGTVSKPRSRRSAAAFFASSVGRST